MAGFCLDRAGAWKPLRKAGRRGGATSARSWKAVLFLFESIGPYYRCNRELIGGESVNLCVN